MFAVVGLFCVGKTVVCLYASHLFLPWKKLDSYYRVECYLLAKFEASLQLRDLNSCDGIVVGWGEWLPVSSCNISHFSVYVENDTGYIEQADVRNGKTLLSNLRLPLHLRNLKASRYLKRGCCLKKVWWERWGKKHLLSSRQIMSLDWLRLSCISKITWMQNWRYLRARTI